MKCFHIFETEINKDELIHLYTISGLFTFEKLIKYLNDNNLDLKNQLKNFDENRNQILSFTDIKTGNKKEFHITKII